MLRSAGGRLAGVPRGRTEGDTGAGCAPLPAGGRIPRRPGGGRVIKTSKIKILRDVVMLLHLLVRKIKKHKFRHVLQKSVMKK